MIPFIEHWVGTSWLAFTLLWVAAAFTSKRTCRSRAAARDSFRQAWC